MASTRLRQTKDGRKYYEIRCRPGRNKPELGTRWYVPDGWCQASIDRELKKVACNFEQQVKDGKVQTVKEKKQLAAEAEAKAEAERAKIKTLREYCENVYMPAKAIGLSENGRLSYQGNIDNHLLPFLGSLPMKDITAGQITACLLNFQKTHAHGSVIKLYNIIRSVFDMAFMDDTIPVNPCLKVKRPKPRKDEIICEAEEQKALTAEKLQYVIDCLKKEPLKWQCYVTLAADLGARRGEIGGLQWSDFNFESLKVTIVRNLQHSKNKGVYTTSPKSGKGRTVDIGEDTAELLKKWKREQASNCISKWVFNQDEYKSPEVMYPTSPTRYFANFGKKYNVPGFHPHLLRHTNASVSITNGADVLSVSARLGHSNPSTTLRMYSHANEESIRRAGDVFRSAISKAKKAESNTDIDLEKNEETGS